MANKFTQSVLERLEQEQKTQPKAAKAQSKTVVKAAEVKDAVKAKNTKPQTKKSAEPELKVKAVDADKEASIADSVAVAEPVFPDISEFLRIEPSRVAKNKTFYLDADVIDALCAAARRQNVTDSKLCNDILRRVLGLK